MTPSKLTASEASRAIASGKLTSEALLRSCLERIQEQEGKVKAFAHLAEGPALKVARALDQMPSKGPLHGIPFAAKDIIDSHDMPTSYGSAIYTGAQPFADASCIALARRSGGILLGKTVTTEFANLTPNETRNPVDINRTPGGSSSGSAAAVAAGMVPVAFGTQTTQSTIRPSAFCGTHGYNPTTGDFRMSGIREAAGTFDRLGLITRSMEDIRLFRDILLLRSPSVFEIASKAPRIGFCRSHLWNEVDNFYKSEWGEGESQSEFNSRIEIVIKNQPGALFSITSIFDKHEINIENIRIANRTKKVYTFIIDISIESSDKLKFVLAEMKTLSQVDKVKRQSINY